MQEYKDLVQRILTSGRRSNNRTGVDTIRVSGEMLKIDLQKGFPVLTCKKTHYKAAIAETIGFFRGYSNASDFRDIGVKVWDKNANDPGKEGHRNAWLDNPYRLGEDDLGNIYGVQWRNWPGFKLLNVAEYTNDKLTDKLEKEGYILLTHFDNSEEEDRSNQQYVYYKPIDQLADCVKKIINTPNDRRIIFHAWNPAELDSMALPPCHLLYQFFPNEEAGEMDMCVYIRSNDVGLGTPFNLIGAATILSIIARITGYEPRWLTIFIGDAHIYVNQLDYINELLTKEPLPLPNLSFFSFVPAAEEFKGCSKDNRFSRAMHWLDSIRPDYLSLENYQWHDLETPVPEMAV